MASIFDLISPGELLYIAWVLACFLLFLYLFVTGLERKDKIRIFFGFLFLAVIIIASVAMLG